MPYVKLLPYNALVLITSKCPLINLYGDVLQTTVRIINTGIRKIARVRFAHVGARKMKETFSSLCGPERAVFF